MVRLLDVPPRGGDLKERQEAMSPAKRWLWAAPRFLVQSKWEFSSTFDHIGMLSLLVLIFASRSQAALNSFGVL
jgi:hypothetical protein